MTDVNIAIGVGLGFGLGLLGAGIGQGLTASAAVTGMSRQPEAAGKIQIAMLLGMALIESLFIFTWLALNGMAGKVPAPTANENKTSAISQPAPTRVAANLRLDR